MVSPVFSRQQVSSRAPHHPLMRSLQQGLPASTCHTQTAGHWGPLKRQQGHCRAPARSHLQRAMPAQRLRAGRPQTRCQAPIHPPCYPHTQPPPSLHLLNSSSAAGLLPCPSLHPAPAALGLVVGGTRRRRRPRLRLRDGWRSSCATVWEAGLRGGVRSHRGAWQGLEP